MINRLSTLALFVIELAMLSLVIAPMCYGQPMNGYYETADNIHFQPPTFIPICFVLWVTPDIPVDSKIDSACLEMFVVNTSTDWVEGGYDAVVDYDTLDVVVHHLSFGKWSTTTCRLSDEKPYFWKTIDTLDAPICEHNWKYSGVIVDGINVPYRYRMCSRCGLHEKQWKVFYERGDSGYDKAIRRFEAKR